MNIRIRSTFSLYWLAVLFLWVKTYVIYRFYFNLSVHSWVDQLLLFVNPLGSAMLLIGLGFFFAKRIKAGYIFLASFIGTAILYADILYHRFYIDFITIPVLFQFKNVGGLGASTLELINVVDVFLFVDLLVFAWVWKKKSPSLSSAGKKRKLAVVSAGIVLVLANISVAKANEEHLFSGIYNREALVESIGAFNYHLYDLYQVSKLSTKQVFADGSEIDKIEQYVEENHQVTKPGYFGAARGKNLIIVTLESTQDFVINRKIKGEEVTPFLNDLIGESFYFDHFYHQTAQGKTSDAEFIIDNSLYPLASGSVFVRKPENEYTALPEILDGYGYYSAAFHGNVKTFWNRSEMYDTLGYDKYFSKQYYNVTEENSVNYGIKDIPFFEQSMDELTSLPEPFYAKFLTLTNHFPFLLHEDVMIPKADTDEGVVNRYFTTVRYEDEAVKRFFELLKMKGLYKDSVIVLVGDHYGISENYYDALAELFDDKLSATDKVRLQQVPLFIHIPGMEGKTIHKVSGQIDLRPTLLHLLGVETNEYIHFGHDLFSEKHPEFVVFRDGSLVTEQYIYTERRCFSRATGETVKRSLCQPFLQKRTKELQYSDSIIYGDLLRFYGEKQKQ